MKHNSEPRGLPNPDVRWLEATKDYQCDTRSERDSVSSRDIELRKEKAAVESIRTKVQSTVQSVERPDHEGHGNPS